MVLNKYRSNVDPIMKPIARKLQKVNPDVLSWLAILFAVLAGYLFIAAWEHDHDLLLLAFIAIVLNSVLDALDGYVARFTGKASRLGDFLDHVLDRYADAFIFGVFFTSYMGTQGQAIGLTRNYGGILGRADRLALLLFFTLAQWVYFVVTDGVYLVTLEFWGTAYPVTVMEVFMVIVAIGGNITALQRGTAAWKDLKQMEADGRLEEPEAPQGLVTVEAVDEDEKGPTDVEGDEDVPGKGQDGGDEEDE